MPGFSLPLVVGAIKGVLTFDPRFIQSRAASSGSHVQYHSGRLYHQLDLRVNTRFRGPKWNDKPSRLKIQSGNGEPRDGSRRCGTPRFVCRTLPSPEAESFLRTMLRVHPLQAFRKANERPILLAWRPCPQCSYTCC